MVCSQSLGQVTDPKLLKPMFLVTPACHPVAGQMSVRAPGWYPPHSKSYCGVQDISPLLGLPTVGRSASAASHFVFSLLFESSRGRSWCPHRAIGGLLGGSSTAQKLTWQRIPTTQRLKDKHSGSASAEQNDTARRPEKLY